MIRHFNDDELAAVNEVLVYDVQRLEEEYRQQLRSRDGYCKVNVMRRVAAIGKFLRYYQRGEVAIIYKED